MRPEEVLRAEEAATRARLEALRADLTALHAATADANTDDEHDPEGATIAWERQQLVATIARQRERLAALAEALTRAEAGDGDVCATCGGPIGAERLAARPGTTVCVNCAR